MRIIDLSSPIDASAHEADPVTHEVLTPAQGAQHMSEQLYADWKRGIVVEAFRQRGLAPDIAPLQRVPPGSRRRAVLTCQRAGEKITLGYHGRRSHTLFDLERPSQRLILLQ